MNRSNQGAHREPLLATVLPEIQAVTVENGIAFCIWQERFAQGSLARYPAIVQLPNTARLARAGWPFWSRS